MSRYDPNSMTRVLDLEKYDFRDKPSECHTDSEDDESESINGIFKTDIKGEDTSKQQQQRGGFFAKRLGLSRKDRERDAADESTSRPSNASADFAAGSVKSENTEAKLRASVDTHSDETFVTMGTALTGDHVNALLKGHKESNVSDSKEKDEDDKSNDGVEDYWKASEPGTVIRHSTKVPIPVDEDDEEIPISERIDKHKAERRGTSTSMQTAPFDGNLDLSNDGRGDDADIEDDLLKYAAAIEKEFVSTLVAAGSGGSDKRPMFVKPASAYSDVASSAETEKAGNGRAVDFADDEGNGLGYARKSSVSKLKDFFAGGGNVATPGTAETYDLRESDPVTQAAINARKEKKKKKGWSRKSSGGTTDSMWSWSQPGMNLGRRTSDQSNLRSSDGSNSAPNAADYAPEDDDKSHSSVGTFDRSWLGLGGNPPQSNGRGGASWRDPRRMTLTPFVDSDGHPFHSQRSTPYRPGARNLKRCIVVLFVIAVVVLAGALIAFNIPSEDESSDGEPMTKGTVTSALTDAEQLEVKKNVNKSCSTVSVEIASGRHKCQAICHNHFCCFDTEEDGYNCKSDKDKYCMLYAGCAVLLGDLIGGEQALAPGKVEHVDSSTLSSRVKDACSNVENSFGKFGCQKVCEDHMCCFEKDESKNCEGNAKMNCSAYEACSALSGEKVSSSAVGTVGEKNPSDVEVELPGWDTAEKEENVMTLGAGGISDDGTEQVFIPPSSSVSIEAAAISSEGVTTKEVDDACQNLSTIRGRKQCNKLCEDHMCCFENDETKACLTDSNCSVYGSCVYLTSPDSSISLADEDEDDDTTKNVDDQFGYADDDMFVVDTEAVDADAYDSTVYHIGNRTVVGLEIADLSPEEEETKVDWSPEEASEVEYEPDLGNDDDRSFSDDDIFVVDTEDLDYDAYDSTVYHLDVRRLRG